MLFVMRSLPNPELFTQEEKEVNRKSAADYAAADDDATTATAYAADYTAAYADTAAYAADAAYAYAAAERWVKEFFERSGEDKQTYIDEVERLKGE